MAGACDVRAKRHAANVATYRIVNVGTHEAVEVRLCATHEREVTVDEALRYHGRRIPTTR